MPQKNPYLSKFKENISSQQKSVRRALGQDINPPPKSNRLEVQDDTDFPSIDDESVDNRIDQKSGTRYDYFNNDAEESLRFFKKNLLPTKSAMINEESKKSTAPRLSDYTEQRHRSTGSFIDRQPSLSSTRAESSQVARSRAPLNFSSTTKTEVPNSLMNNNDYMSPPTTKVPIKDNSRIESKYTHKSAVLQSSSPINDNIDNPLKPSKSNRSSITKIPESPIPPEVFSRKPVYNSLLRAHDSIRLKVNRPKVRPKSEGLQVPDTELDDSIQLAEINTDTDQLNERAVDVKRRSSRKKNKSKFGHKEVEDEKPATPVRNFSEVRVVKVVRSDTERSLGVTVRTEEGNIVVARILAGSLADKQGALQVGDVILAVNNKEVYTPEQLQEQLRKSSQEDTVLLKIVPSFKEELPTLCIYLRTLFNYDPNEDTLLPCKEVGVAFNQGDILEVVNQEDPNWWQARRVDSENLQTGLIPSQELEERRRAFVIPEHDLATRTSICGTKVSRKSKKKEVYNVGLNCDFDRAEVQLYEEVCRTPAFERRTLVLIGANGVGKQALKARLIAMDPDRFGTPLPHTSRLPRDGEENGIHYHFVTREKMEEDIIAGKYLEYGEYDGALYGTKLDSIREIIASGRVCILDCSPTCLKVLKTPDYLPFVAFIAAPTLDQLRYMQEWNRGNKTYETFDRTLSRQSRRAKTLHEFAFDFFEDEDLQLTVEESAKLFRVYGNYFDIVLVNNEFNLTFEALRESIDSLSMAPQWIPISWIYGS